MKETIEERLGKMTLSNIFTSVWLGDWDQYDQAFHAMPTELKDAFPFHAHYDRDQVTLWYENYFFIPGDYFVSPYYSSYMNDHEMNEARKHNLIGLIGIYEKYGFYYPLEKERFPDHIGCMTAFLSSAINEQIKALDSNDPTYASEMAKVEEEIVLSYIAPTLRALLVNAEDKILHPFFKDFLQYYTNTILEEWYSPTI